jgi:hypothetical protein
MLRNLTGAVAVLVLAGVAVTAQEKKDAPPKTVVGMFESYKDEVLTLTVDGKKQTFKVPGDTMVAFTAGPDKKKIIKAKDGLKDVAKGTFAAVTLAGEKVLGVGVVVASLPKDK